MEIGNGSSEMIKQAFAEWAQILFLSCQAVASGGISYGIRLMTP
jgi:hypothetical protein